MHQLLVATFPQPAAGADWGIVPSSSDRVALRSITARLVTSATAGTRLADLLTTDDTNNAVARDIAPVAQAPSTTMLYSWRPSHSQYGTDAAQPSGSGVPAPGAGGQSKSASGQVTSPGAGAAIATLAAPGVGTYTITVQAAFLGGAPTAAADSLNYQLQVGASVIGPLPAVPVTAGSVGPPATFANVAVPAATAVTVNAIAAGTVGAIYSANIVATIAAAPAAGALAAGSCPGFWLPATAKVATVTAGIAAGDQWSQIVATYIVGDDLALQHAMELIHEYAEAVGVHSGV